MKKRPPVQIHVDPEKEKKTVLNNVAFTQVGELGRLLVVGDLVYAGIFEPPTLEEMSTMIHKVNKGGNCGVDKATRFIGSAYYPTSYRCVIVRLRCCAFRLDTRRMGWNGYGCANIRTFFVQVQTRRQD